MAQSARKVAIDARMMSGLRMSCLGLSALGSRYDPAANSAAQSTRASANTVNGSQLLFDVMKTTFEMTNDQAPMTNIVEGPIGHWDLVIGHLDYKSTVAKRNSARSNSHDRGCAERDQA